MTSLFHIYISNKYRNETSSKGTNRSSEVLDNDSSFVL